MKKAIILPLIFMGLGIFLTPTKANAGSYSTCEPWENYLTGEINGVKYDMANVYTDPNIDDETKK